MGKLAHSAEKRRLTFSSPKNIVVDRFDQYPGPFKREDWAESLMAYTCSKSLMALDFLRQGGFAKINLHSKVHNLETRRHFMYAGALFVWTISVLLNM